MLLGKVAVTVGKPTKHSYSFKIIGHVASVHFVLKNVFRLLL